MLVHQCFSKSRQALFGVWRDYKLVGIGARLVRYSHRFAAPDQSGSAAAESSPASDCALGRIAIRSTIPTLHRLNRDAVAHFEAPSH